jgi:Rieske Fe-S protein
MQCTHQENQLDVTGNGFSCSLHGSQFDKDGNVLKGPAEDHLQRYKTTIKNNNLVIEVPKQP